MPVTVLLTMGMALLCNRVRKLSFLYETLFALPMAVSMSAVALIYKIMLNPSVGIVNAVTGSECAWYQGRDTALLSIILLTVWMGLGFNFLFFLASVRSVPECQIEAARLDGAGPVGIFFHIQLPHMLPTVGYVVCTNTVQALMTSGPIIILTQGGPSRATTTLIYMMYTQGYGSSNYSLAACVSLFTFALAFVFTLLGFIADRRRRAAE